jgi:hypothetical protein
VRGSRACRLVRGSSRVVRESGARLSRNGGERDGVDGLKRRVGAVGIPGVGVVEQ